ncbi:MAG: site-specific DNA-methyltransferase, partial [Clostridiales Family XIII bacterium]|nr:site-specific DNA-methyltransferase [Clostridiales Family XIII bacterium]
NRGLKPYRFKGVKEYKDEGGWYTMVNMKDVWQLDMVGRTSAERTGYATQKPEALIARILESCTKEGDLCADFFCGSGTLGAAAEKLGRRWLMCDSGRLAAVNAHKRMVQAGSHFCLMAGRADRDMEGGFAAEYSSEETLDTAKRLVSVTLKRYALPAAAPGAMSGAPAAGAMAGMPAPGTVAGMEPAAEAKGCGAEPCAGVAAAVSIPVGKDHIQAINDVLENDSLQLVDYWSVDFRYNGREFRPHVSASRENYSVDNKIARIMGDFGPIAVRVVDIFGNSSFRVL